MLGLSAFILHLYDVMSSSTFKNLIFYIICSAASCGFCMIKDFGSMFGQHLLLNVKADF